MTYFKNLSKRVLEKELLSLLAMLAMWLASDESLSDDTQSKLKIGSFYK